MSDEKTVELTYPCTGKKSQIGRLVLVLESPEFKESKKKEKVKRPNKKS